MNTPFLFRKSMSASKLASILLVGLLLQNALLVLWIEYDIPLFFRVWGFSVVPTYLVPVVLMFFLFRINWEVLGNVKKLLGPLRFWIIALGVPLLAFGGAGFVAVEFLNPKIGWRWTTYALSGAADLPLNLFFLLPLLIVQAGLWLATPMVWSEKKSAVLIAGGLMVLSQTGLLVPLALSGEPITIAAAVILLFSAGAFSASLLLRAGIIVTSFALLLCATAAALLFGLEVEVLANFLIGYDVKTVEGLISAKHHLSYAIPIGAFLLITALLIPTVKDHR